MSKGKAILYSIAAFVAVIAVGLGLMYTTGYLQRFTADFRGKTGQIERVYADPASRIARYEYFYDTDASIQAVKDNICVMEDSAVNEKDTNLVALKAKLNNLVNEYNAASRKTELGADVFRGADLPYQQDKEYTC